MPLNKFAYARYTIIDRLLTDRRKPHPSMEDLIAACSRELGKTFSVSQIQKDIQTMKEDQTLGFRAPIKFSKHWNGYYYNEQDYSIKKIPLSSEELEALHLAADLLKVFSGTRVSKYFDEAVNKIDAALKVDFGKNSSPRLPVVEVEHPVAHKGFEHFELLVQAAENHTPVSFVHYSYSKRRFNPVILHVYLIKEFHNRWYVIGYSETHKEIRIFGLDRTYGPLLLNREFKQVLFNRDLYTKDLYGLMPLREMKTEEILFEVSAHLSNYMLANPLHGTQEVVKYHPHGALLLKLEVIPTRELLNDFLMHCPELTVMKPTWLRNEFNRSLQKGMQYEQTH